VLFCVVVLVSTESVSFEIVLVSVTVAVVELLSEVPRVILEFELIVVISPVTDVVFDVASA
jgi:hypothetical protein